MIYLYSYTVPNDEKMESLPYLRKAVAEYIAMKGAQTEYPQSQYIQIEKTERGKPIMNLPGIFVSATHTQRHVICGISDENLGIDAELPERRRREIPYDKIAERFFTPLEQQYVKTAGREGFFEIWVRKEAYMKYTGQGMAFGFQNIETRKEVGFQKDSAHEDGFREGGFQESGFCKDGFSEEINGCPIRFQRIGTLFFASAGGTEELKWMNEPQWMNGTRK